LLEARSASGARRFHLIFIGSSHTRAILPLDTLDLIPAKIRERTSRLRGTTVIQENPHG
jgi:hypothetical protein